MTPSRVRQIGTPVLLLGASLAMQPALGLSDGNTLSFSGGLERVGNGSLSLRLADRRVIDATLPTTPGLEASSLTAHYRMYDQVEIVCRPIPPVWEQSTARYQSLELTSIRLIQRPTPEDLAKTATAGFHEGKNLLQTPAIAAPTPSRAPDSNAPGGRELEHARQVNLQYAANMPNFVADEKAKRYRKAPRSASWRDFDTVESEITFRGNHAARQAIRRDGKPWDQPFEALPGFKWYEGFGTEITPLFDAKCSGEIEYQGRSKVNGKPALDYRFSTPVDSCFPFFFFDYQRYNPARSGGFAIDEPDGHIVQLDEEASGFPEEIQFANREEHISWDYVKIAGDSHLLPVRASFLVKYYDGTEYRIEVEYKNHRHFEASTNLTFHE